MNIIEKISLFSNLLESLNNVSYYSRDDFDTIEGKAKMYIRKFFGDNSHYLEEIERISYSPRMFFASSENDFFEDHFNSGLKKLRTLIGVILKDLKLSTNYEAVPIEFTSRKTKQKPITRNKKSSLNNKEIHILIASPGDVVEDRELLLNSLETKFRRAEYESRCGYRILVRGWEELASQSGYGQDIINTEILSKVDIVLAVFKHKLGTPTKDLDTGEERSKSGTAEELLYAIRNNDVKNPPLGMAYFYSEAPKMSFDSPSLSTSLKDWDDLKKFKEDIKDDILYKSYKTGEDLLDTACEDIVKNIEKYFA